MKLTDFTYELPDDLIAYQPAERRGGSRLLVLGRRTGQTRDDRYKNVAQYFESGDVLVLNDTKVIKARLLATRSDGAERELVLLEKHGSADDWYRHKVMYRRKLAPGDELRVGRAELIVEQILGDGLAIIKSDRDLLDVAAEYGQVPLPPYIKRQATDRDVERYQTVWAQQTGSVAAPTASLNMTDEVLDELRQKGVEVVYLTLHVGLGTFLPIRADNLEDHKMHQEYFEIPAATVRAIQGAKGRVIALGTTVARTLEYSHEQLKEPARTLQGEADIFIYPGYQFKTIDGLLTNFHAPKSTVLMMAAAFAGWNNLQAAYTHAIDQKYSFLSYGDSMLIL